MPAEYAQEKHIFPHYGAPEDDNDDSDWLQRHLVSGRTPSLRRTPSVPSNAKARALSSTSLMIQWDKPTESSLEMTYPLTHEVHYTSNPILETAVWSKQVASGNNFTIVSGLTPFTVYTIRVNGHNAYGPGLLSPVVFQQAGSQSSPKPLDLLSTAFFGDTMSLDQQQIAK
ncbi:unnamed protein product [Darwinula stevensoni]|uniref:Fibronectin type-III domain-containing protein n=1 Tax=Darwinula stevensoni TaxID=69355 RepID=A0A7R9AFB9_9CRUS|nr:unnamed protein product [Darwinula stevensoni]CAG0903138.1 unnamed protein product [Darwinula stevensoni]